jgi:hypothetical protein
MPSSSHQYCQEPGCRIRVHKQNRYGRCYQHYKRYEERLQKERRRIKRMRAERRMTPLSEEVQAAIDRVAPNRALPKGVHVADRLLSHGTFIALTAEREDPMPEPPVAETTAVAVASSVDVSQRKYRNYPPPANLSDDEKQEILLHYENLEIPVTAIASYFHISSPSLLGLLEEFGVTQRAKRPDFEQKTKPRGHFTRGEDGHSEWVVDTPLVAPDMVERAIPEPQRKALETMLQPPPPAPAPQPAVVPAAPTGRHGTLWKVTLTTSIEVRGGDVDAVLGIVRRSYPQARITSIAEMPGTTV